jgi:glucosamine-6-phosphate deaminase
MAENGQGENDELPRRAKHPTLFGRGSEGVKLTNIDLPGQNLSNVDMSSNVEKRAVEESGQQMLYPSDERIPAILVDGFPSLGTLTAMRFLEWAQANPEGVVSLPTGRTPEHFIKEVDRLRKNWSAKDARREMERWGLDPSSNCDLRGLRFVQIDEFYPIDPRQTNSFYYYVNKFYIQGFGLDAGRAMLMDCTRIGMPEGRTLEEVWPEGAVDLSLRYRSAKTRLERLQKDTLEGIDQWCSLYEERVRSMGGIDFFLGGIGPDGHIGFNVRGADLHSTTRLTPMNYETQAAAAADLGGMEIARTRLVITIGLATITYNRACVAIIAAAGEAKAGIVASSIRSDPDVRYPASVLQRLPDARFYLTKGAAGRLKARRLAVQLASGSVGDRELERVVIDLALEKQKALEALAAEDFAGNAACAALLGLAGKEPVVFAGETARKLKEKVEAGARSRTSGVFLHTEPHHDDLMLGYMPFIVRHIRQPGTRHYFATLTSGFTAVTNAFMLRRCRELKRYMRSEAFLGLLAQGYFEPGVTQNRNRDVWQYLDGVAAGSASMKEDGEMRRMYRNLSEVYEERDHAVLAARVDELIGYFQTQYPGKRDLEPIQRLKGMRREWEAECLWGYFGWSGDSVRHLRLGFYTGDIFTREPTGRRDVPPILQLLRSIRPDVVTVALDPEASGPDTHYKVLQAVTEALKLYQEETGRNDMEILGYRNLWFRFHPSEADICVPVSLNMFSLQHSAFMNTMVSQREASYPSHELDGPFCDLAQKIQVEQFRMLETCLGREYFNENASPIAGSSPRPRRTLEGCRE